MNWKKRICALLCAAACAASLLAGCAGSPAKAEVPDTIRWINATHAILTDMNGWDCAVFGGMEATEANKKLMIPFLDEWWGVTDHDSAEENIEWLLTEGHRAEFVEFMALLDEDGWAEYSEEETAAMMSELLEDEDDQKELIEEIVRPELHRRLGLLPRPVPAGLVLRGRVLYRERGPGQGTGDRQGAAGQVLLLG